MESRRSDRVAGLLQREVGRILDARLTDPRLGKLVTVSRVTVTPDLARATIAVTVMGDASDAAEAMQGLESASGLLRREIGQRVGLKRVPELHFVQDIAIEQGDHVLDLLDTLKTEVRHSRVGGNLAPESPALDSYAKVSPAGEPPSVIPAQAGTQESPPPSAGRREEPSE